MKQRNIPWLGAFMESFFVTLPILSVINFWAIIAMLYATVRPYLLEYLPWMTIWLFVCILTAIGILGMVLVYKFVLPSIWTFRGGQMFGYENQLAGRMGINKTKKPGITVAVAGGFDPLNGAGHLTHIQEAKKLGDRLIVILSRDDQLRAKGNKPNGTFYPSINDRLQIIREMRSVDEVVVNMDIGTECAETLRQVRPNIFAKGGDRVPSNMPECELDMCKEIGCKIVYNVGSPKTTSSSELVRAANRTGQ